MNPPPSYSSPGLLGKLGLKITKFEEIGRYFMLL